MGKVLGARGVFLRVASSCPLKKSACGALARFGAVAGGNADVDGPLEAVDLDVARLFPPGVRS